MLDVEFLWKDVNSGGNGCPALIRGRGGYYVQGKIVDAATRADLQPVSEANNAALSDDEDIVFVPYNVLDRLRG